MPADEQADDNQPTSDDGTIERRDEVVLPTVPDEQAPDASEPAKGDDSVLNDSALGRGLVKLGELSKDYANWLVIILVAAAVIAWALNLRAKADAQAALVAKGEMTRLQQELVEGARGLSLRAPTMTEDQVADRVSEFETVFQQSIELIESGADSDAMRAQAARLEGDYHWYLASMPVAQPATRPADAYNAPASADARLNSAEQAYQRVLDDYNDFTTQRVAALFGLAAIFEERTEFEAAGERYEAIVNGEAVPEPFKALARQRRNQLAYLTTNSPLIIPDTPTPLGQESGVDLGSLGEDDTPSSLTDLGVEGLTLTPPAASTSQPATQPATQPAP